MKYGDVMVDIESLATTQDAVMIQLAGVYFNRHTGETGLEFCQSLDIEQCIADGFVTSDDTIRWWMTQPEEVYKAVTTDQKHPLEVMKAFDDFYNGQKMWGHGIFDFGLVDAYSRKYLNKPLPYRSMREIRTLVDFSGVNVDSLGEPEQAHNAISDCHFQIKYVCHALAKIKGRTLADNNGNGIQTQSA